jgi:hypothetical protein
MWFFFCETRTGIFVLIKCTQLWYVGIVYVQWWLSVRPCSVLLVVRSCGRAAEMNSFRDIFYFLNKHPTIRGNCRDGPKVKLNRCHCMSHTQFFTRFKGVTHYKLLKYMKKIKLDPVSSDTSCPNVGTPLGNWVPAAWREQHCVRNISIFDAEKEMLVNAEPLSRRYIWKSEMLRLRIGITNIPILMQILKINSHSTSRNHRGNAHEKGNEFNELTR